MASPASTVNRDRAIPDHPERDPEVEQLLDERGVDWHFEPNLPLDFFNHEDSLRNQARIVPLIDEVVARYRDLWLQGRRPKAVVSLANGVRLDGNHRAGSLLAALDEIRKELPDYQPTLSAYIVDKAAPHTIAVLKVELNNRHGQPPTDGERVMHAVRLAQLPRTRIKEIAPLVGLSESRIRNELARANADERAQGMDLVGFQSLAPQTRGRLGNIKNDAAFIAAFDLVRAAHLDHTATSALATAVNATRSEKAALDVVLRARQEHGSRVRATAGGLAKITVAASPTKLVELLNRVLNVDIDGLLEVVARPPDREHLVGLVDEATGKLDTLAKELRGGK